MEYNELGLYRGKEKSLTLEAAQALWEMLPAWMDARRMALIDPEYNRKISGVIAENAEIVLKAAREMEEAAFSETDPLCAALDEASDLMNHWRDTMNNPWQREDRAYRKELAKALQDKLKKIIG